MKKNKKEPAKEIIMKKIATLNPKEKAAVSGGRYGHRGHHGRHGKHEKVPEGTVGIQVDYLDKDGKSLGGTCKPYTGEHKGWSHHQGWGHRHEWGNKRTILKQLITDYAITHKKLSEAIDKARSHLSELADFRASISQLLEGRELEFETLPKDLDLDYYKE